MKVLLLHNYYQQSGGEDAVVEREKTLLQTQRHEVHLLLADNGSIKGPYRQIASALSATYSRKSRVHVEKEINSFRPDVVHVHNFFPLLSPSVYYACRAASVPVVQTLHNFRLICPNALLFRKGKPCEDCVGKTIPWPGVVHACYRNSRLGTAAVAAMTTSHRICGTWSKNVSAYIAPTQFARQKLIAGGLPADRLFVKPNFVTPDSVGIRTPRGYALFVGRLSPEKGVATLIAAWRRMGEKQRLKIVGDGPSHSLLRAVAAANSNIQFLGHKNASDVQELMKHANFLILPSECYETFGLAIIEAFAQGLPVLGSCLGSIQELIEHGRTGMLFQPGNSEELADTAEWLFTHPAELEQMSKAALLEFEKKYTADRNYEQLIAVYKHVIVTGLQHEAPSASPAVS